MSTQRTSEINREGGDPFQASRMADVGRAIQSGAGKLALHPQVQSLAWEGVPPLWRAALALDVLAFAIPGALCLLFPGSALDWHRSIAHAFHWAGPSPGVASNVLILYVQVLGAVALALAGIPAWGSALRSADVARGWALFRTLLSLCLLYVSSLQPGASLLSTLSSPIYHLVGLKAVYAPGSTTFKTAILPFLHSALTTSLLVLSPAFLASVWAKAPAYTA